MKPNVEIQVTFTDPQLVIQHDRTERIIANLQLSLIEGSTVKESRQSAFTAPIGLLETNELAWYLESYLIWPVGLFKERALKLEQCLPEWGKQLLDALTPTAELKNLLHSYLNTSNEAELSINLQVKSAETNSQIATTRLLGLPWELLLHNGEHLSLKTNAVKIHRNISTNKQSAGILDAGNVVRVLAISPRPAQSGYFDHRISIQPLVESLASLGNSAELVRVIPPTITQLEQVLQEAQNEGKPFTVLHFDGHGTFDLRKGKGALLFEHQIDVDEKKILPEFQHKVYADQLASLLSKFPVPLVFLEACQTGQSNEDPNSSVASALLQAGVSTVIAMSHVVLVETARCFVSAFYQSLAKGKSIGTALLEGRHSLVTNAKGMAIPGAGKFQLQDWYVPLLYQNNTDPKLFTQGTSLKLIVQQDLVLGSLPAPPSHSFTGRSRELLMAERLLEYHPYAVINGMGGIGKTALTTELAHWLVESQKFDRCAFVSCETFTHVRAMMDSLGRQLIGGNYTVSEYGDHMELALEPIQEALEKESVLLVIDNMESLLGEDETLEPVLEMLSTLQPSTKLLFTSRERLPSPFNKHYIELSSLSKLDAQTLIINVMQQQKLLIELDKQDHTLEQVQTLIASVGGHPRALVLIAKEIAKSGVLGTTEAIQKIMIDLESQHSGERELSLLSSVKLSLDRLSPGTVEKISGLAVYHHGGGLNTMMQVLQVEGSEIQLLANKLIQVGLAKAEKDYGYLSLDPALSRYLLLSLSEEKINFYQKRWQAVMGKLTNYLYEQMQKDTVLSFTLTQQELPNFIAYLDVLDTGFTTQQFSAEHIVEKTSRIEQLLANLNYPQILIKVIALRLRATKNLGAWDHTAFKSQHMTINRFEEVGDFNQAYKTALQLLDRCKKAGSEAYIGADFDLAMVNFKLAKIMTSQGLAAEALLYIEEAKTRFRALDGTHDRMIGICFLEQGKCLQALGRVEEAASAYKENIQYAEQLNDTRQIAVGKGQLASVYLDQENYKNALKEYKEVRSLFEKLNEPKMIAAAWHQIGMTHMSTGDNQQSEIAYRRAIAIKNQHNDMHGEASSLNELGNLYTKWQRLEEAVKFYQHTIDIYVVLGNKFFEGVSRTNLADLYLTINRFDSARDQLQQAIKCKEGLGFAAERWKTWNVLHSVELAANNTIAAKKAWDKASNLYLEYRMSGGENKSGAGQLCEIVAQSLGQGKSTELEALMDELLEKDGWNKPFLHALRAIYDGSRDASVFNNCDIPYDGAAELALLLRNNQ